MKTRDFYHRLRAAKFSCRLRTLWQLHVNRPVCDIHGPWTIDEVQEGFCGRCLDNHLEGRWPEFLDLDADEGADHGAAVTLSDVSTAEVHCCTSTAERFGSWPPTEIVYSGILQSGRRSA